MNLIVGLIAITLFYILFADIIKKIYGVVLYGNLCINNSGCIVLSNKVL